MSPPGRPKGEYRSAPREGAAASETPPDPAAADAAGLLQRLQAGCAAGWLRPLDLAFARFIHDLDPAGPAAVVLAAGLLAHLEGQGHSCLALEPWLTDPAALPGWPDDALALLRELEPRLPQGLQAWAATLRSSPLVDSPRQDLSGPVTEGTLPLVFDGWRLYLRRLWRHEQRVAQQLLQRAASPRDHDPALARAALDRLFATPAPGRTDFDWQRLACALALRRGLTLITGGPGTGKTYTAARLLALLLAADPRADSLRFALAAPTGKAAARLRQSIAAAWDGLAASRSLPQDAEGFGSDALARIGPAQTLHALLGARPEGRRFRADAGHPLDVDVLIVDEASMIDLEMMSALLQALPGHARLILMGDKDQLSSVEPGAVLADLCRRAGGADYGAETAAFAAAVSGRPLPPEALGPGGVLAQQTVVLPSSRRFGGAIASLAAAVLAGDAGRAAALLRQDTDEALAWLESPPPGALIRLALAGRPGAPGGHAGPGSYLEALSLRPSAADRAAYEGWVAGLLAAFDRFRLLCAVREGEWGCVGLNLAIERALAAAGRVPAGQEWYEGRPIVVGRNEPEVGIFNGDTGIVLASESPPAEGSSGGGPSYRAWFAQGSGVRSVALGRLGRVETAFASTVHKAQGSEFEHAVLVLPPEAGSAARRDLVYTAITRARRSFTLVTPNGRALKQALSVRSVRQGGLADQVERGATVPAPAPG